MTDAKAPERIWATGDTRNGSWTHEQVPEKWGAAVTEFVRADLYDAAIKQRDELRAEVERLRGVMKVLHDDMLERAQCEVDVIYGEEYRVVNAGNSAWAGFVEALQRKEGNE